jgi:hypothetical protein
MGARRVGQPHPIGPFMGPAWKISGFRLGFREKAFFSGPRSGTEIWAILGQTPGGLAPNVFWLRP